MTASCKLEAHLLLDIVKIGVFRFHLGDFFALSLDFLAVRLIFLECPASVSYDGISLNNETPVL